MHRTQGDYLVPLLHLIMMGAMAGVVYGCWLISGWISGLIIAAEDHGKDWLGRVFITMAVLSAFTVVLTIINYHVFTLPREKRRANFREDQIGVSITTASWIGKSSILGRTLLAKVANTHKKPNLGRKPMITPGEARQLGGKDKTAKQTVLDFVYTKIKNSAEQGAASIFVPVNYGFNPAAFQEAMEELKALGYRMTEEDFDRRPHIRIWW